MFSMFSRTIDAAKPGLVWAISKATFNDKKFVNKENGDSSYVLVMWDWRGGGLWSCGMWD